MIDKAAGFLNAFRMIADDSPQPVAEFVFHPDRKWRFDAAWPDLKIAVEIEGTNYNRKSRHTSHAGYQKDCEKYNAAALLGWRVLRYTAADFESRPVQVIEQIKLALMN